MQLNFESCEKFLNEQRTNKLIPTFLSYRYSRTFDQKTFNEIKHGWPVTVQIAQNVPNIGLKITKKFFLGIFDIHDKMGTL